MENINKERLRLRFNGVLNVATEILAETERSIREIEVKTKLIEFQIVDQNGAPVGKKVTEPFANKLRETLAQRHPSKRYRVKADDRYYEDPVVWSEGGTAYYITVSLLEEFVVTE